VERSEVSDQPPDYRKQLPEDSLEALSEVFRQELVRAMFQAGKGLVKVTDRLHELDDDGSFPYGGPPFFYDQRPPRFKKKPEFQALRIAEVQLDPIARFCFERKPAIEVRYYCFR
jgi:hypothetical protein